MSGRPPWTKPHDEVSNSSKSVKFKTYEHTSTVSAGNSEVVEITAPAGKVWNIQSIKVSIDSPGGDGSANHDVFVRSSNFLHFCQFNNTDDSKIVWNRHMKRSGTSGDPNTDQEIAQAVGRIRCDDTDGIVFAYNNNSTSDNTGSRTYVLNIVEETIDA